MVLAVIYRKNTEQERPIIEFKEMMRRRHPQIDVTEIDADSRDATTKAHTYGFVQYPVILITDDAGRMQGMWEGVPLPLIDEVYGAMLEQQGSSL